MLTGTQGAVEYSIKGKKENSKKILILGGDLKFSFSWNIPKIGKEKVDFEAPPNFKIEQTGSLPYQFLVTRYQEISLNTLRLHLKSMKTRLSQHQPEISEKIP
jgi:hypothetical protein